MKQFTIYENKMDEKPDWSRFRNVDLADISKTEFQGLTPFELPVDSNGTPQTTAVDFRGMWYPTAIDSTHVRLTGGSFTCGSIFTPSVSSISVSSSALTYIYLRATLSPTYVDGYVDGGTATACTVMSGSTIPTSNNTYGYILLCSWQAGALVDRYEIFSLKARLNNSGTGDVQFDHGNA